MAISVDWGTKVVSIPQNYLTFVSGSLYELNVTQFFRDCRDMSDNEDGIVFPRIIRHSTEVTISGVTYARFIEVINGYTVELEDGQYVVNCVGANHNLADVKVANQVSLIVGNAAGLVVSGSGVTAQDKIDIAENVWGRNIEGAYTANDLIKLIAAVLQGNATGLESSNPVFKSIDGTKTRVAANYADGGRTITSRDVT